MATKADEARAVVNLYYMLEQQNEQTSPEDWNTLLDTAIELGREYPRYGNCMFNLQGFIFRAMQEAMLDGNDRTQLTLLQLHVQAISNGLQEP